jgi:hypothetical protein
LCGIAGGFFIFSLSSGEFELHLVKNVKVIGQALAGAGREF